MSGAEALGTGALIAFRWIKASSYIFVVIASVIRVVLVYAREKGFLHWNENEKVKKEA